ncbi:MAG: hypothetical protein Q8N09_10680 [Thermodesulfovibrionia bacterium]|nr:hypothetical protein [Thermodesulfovibrionia bacterium]
MIQIIDIAYIKNTATAFEIAHEFVGLRALITAEAGTFQSFVRNLFHKVDYQSFVNRTREIKDKIDRLDNNVKLLSPPKAPAAEEFAQALHQYIDALSKAVEIFSNKTKFMAAKAKDPMTPETSYAEFKKIIKDESLSLEECQNIGDKLTILYRKNIGMC